LPRGKEFNFRAGGYILLEAPPYSTKFSDFDIDDKYRSTWDAFNLWKYSSNLETPTTSRTFHYNIYIHW